MNMRSTTLFSVVLASIIAAIVAEEVLLKLSHGGEIRGRTLKSNTRRTIYAYRRIPYAEPPTGQLRFKPPVSKAAWKGQPLDATRDLPMCIQKDFLSSSIMGQEDCLFLNVYTPKSPEEAVSDSKIAVMVFLHGGGFTSGSGYSMFYGPGLLLDEDVILVTMNYRLGPFGFFSTEDEVSPGNYGLMDQSLALQWVKDTIRVFGGDENKVTLFGESAGAASVGYHLMSPKSKGLFQAAIAQSGSPLSSWAMQKKPIYWAKFLASDLDCPTQNTKDMVECLRQIPALDIAKILTSDKTSNNAIDMAFVPTIDGIFISTDPKKIMAAGNLSVVPYLGGVNKDEGLLSYAMMKLQTIADLKPVMDAFLTDYFSDGKDAKEAAKLVMEKYFSNLNWTDKDATRKAIVKMFSDTAFYIPHYEMLKALSQNGFPTYTYIMEYLPSVTILKYLGINEQLGVCHADDIGLLFDGLVWGANNIREDDKKMRKMMCTAWANFAKYHNPTPNMNEESPSRWEGSTASTMNIYHINNPVTKSSSDLDKDDVYLFWTKVLPNFL